MSKIALFDIDGTLIGCEHGIIEIRDTVKQALDTFRQRGHLAFVATGRTHCFVVDGVKSYPFDGYITCNGAYVDMDGKCLYKHPVPKEALHAVIDVCEQEDFIYFLESRDQIYVRDKKDPRFLDFADRWEMNLDIVEDQFDKNEIECYIVMAQINSLDQEKILMEKLGNYFDISRHMLGQISYDLNTKGISKATGLKELVKALNKDIKDTYAFGDGRNDLEMIEEAGIGIAMGNGASELKAKADYVCKSIEEDGIIDGLKHYHLI